MHITNAHHGPYNFINLLVCHLSINPIALFLPPYQLCLYPLVFHCTHSILVGIENQQEALPDEIRLIARDGSTVAQIHEKHSDDYQEPDEVRAGVNHYFGDVNVSEFLCLFVAMLLVTHHFNCE